MKKIFLCAISLLILQKLAISQSDFEEFDEQLDKMQVVDFLGWSMADISFVVSQNHKELDARIIKRQYEESYRNYTYTYEAFKDKSGEYYFLGAPIISIEEFYLTSKNFYLNLIYWSLDSGTTILDAKLSPKASVWIKIKKYYDYPSEKNNMLKFVKILDVETIGNEFNPSAFKRPKNVIYEMSSCLGLFEKNAEKLFTKSLYFSGFSLESSNHEFSMTNVLRLDLTDHLILSYKNNLACITFNWEEKNSAFSPKACF